MGGNVDITNRLNKFGCLFDRGPYITIEQMKSIKIKLDIELQVDSDSFEEIIEKLNLYNWIEYKLCNFINAKEQNMKVFDMTKERNLTALVNKVHLCLRDGEEELAEKYLNLAEELRDGKEGEKLMNEIVAELAYSLSRLGGDENLKRAIDMYTAVVEKEPGVYAWKFGLGLLHRRVTHVNVSMDIQSSMSAKEHLESAYDLLRQVAFNNAVDKGLRGRVYSQLALTVWQGQTYYALFGEYDYKAMIKKASQFGSRDARVLFDCGRCLRFDDLNEAIKLFKQSLQIKEHSSTYHYLGMSHQELAKRNSKGSKNKKSQRSKNEQQKGFKYLRMPKSPIREDPLSKDDPDVVRAMENYKRAIDISINRNIPAIYSLGRILRACGEMDEALIQFNKIIYLTSKINYPKIDKALPEDHEYLLTVTCAYEQAGYCYLDLSKMQGKTEQDIEKYNNKAENKFLKAVSFTATLCNLHPDIRVYEEQVWNAFKTLETKTEKMKESPKIIIKYIQLLNSASKHENVPKFIEKLRNLSAEEVADPLFIRTTLESYLTLKQYERALAFLTLPVITQNCEELQQLAFKVNLYTAASRLQASDSSARFILKPLFDFCFEKERTKSRAADKPVADENVEDTQCHDLMTDDMEGTQDHDLMTDDMEGTQGHDLMTDVLIVYDVNEENPSADVSEKVAKLKEIISVYFNLSVIIFDEAQLNLVKLKQEMERAKAVIILLSGHPQSSNFKTLLEFTPTIVPVCTAQGKHTPHIVLGSSDDSVQVPQTLETYTRKNLWSLLNRIPDILNHENDSDLITERQHEGATARRDVITNHQFTGGDGDQSPSTSDPIDAILDQDEPQSSGDEFDDCTSAKMSLYCALIGKDWPL